VILCIFRGVIVFPVLFTPRESNVFPCNPDLLFINVRPAMRALLVSPLLVLLPPPLFHLFPFSLFSWSLYPNLSFRTPLPPKQGAPLSTPHPRIDYELCLFLPTRDPVLRTLPSFNRNFLHNRQWSLKKTRTAGLRLPDQNRPFVPSPSVRFVYAQLRTPIQLPVLLFLRFKSPLLSPQNFFSRHLSVGFFGLSLSHPPVPS